MESRRAVAFALRFLGALDLCAIVPVLMPRSWLEFAHTTAGLGAFPGEPITTYLARSGSALYVLHGALLIYLSYDVEHYWNLIRFLAIAALVHGAVLLGVDLSLDLPRWWKLIEGPAFAATGGIVLWLQNGLTEGKTEGRNSNAWEQNDE